VFGETPTACYGEPPLLRVDVVTLLGNRAVTRVGRSGTEAKRSKLKFDQRWTQPSRPRNGTLSL